MGTGPPSTEIGCTLDEVPDGETVIWIDAVAAELAIDVAVTETTCVVVTDVGALYTTEVVVAPLSVPTPDKVQFTPWLLESLLTTAVIVEVPPALIDCEEAVKDTLIVNPEGVLLPPPQPTSNPNVATTANPKKLRTNDFITVSPLH
jgi:hypothetical protein